MRIAIFTNNYLPNPYGVSMSIESFRRELEKRGHTVYIFAPKFKGYEDLNPNVFRYPSLDVTLRGIRYPIAIPYSYRIGRILEKMEIDVIHSQHPNLLGWAAKKWAKTKNIPLIFTWHTLYDQYAHFVPLIPQKIAARQAISNATKYANSSNEIVVPTPSVAKIIKDWGVLNENISVIASGIDEELYQNPESKEIRKKYNIAEEEILILLVSRLTAEKNVQFIFDALIPLIAKNKKLKFLIAGGGVERLKLENEVKKNGLEENIFFAGVISANRLKNYYNAADLFVHASKSETQGMILTEAMYMGLPIVAVKATGANDLIMHANTGFLTNENIYEFADKVSQLASDIALRKEFSENAKKISRKNFTTQICTSKLIALYEKAITAKLSN